MKKHLLLAICMIVTVPLFAQDAAMFREWGEESLTVIDTYLKANRGTFLYSEKSSSGYPAFAWPTSIQIKALMYADRVKDAENLTNDFHNNYYFSQNGYYGYSASYQTYRGGRYYDDNAWIVKDLMDLYFITGKSDYMKRAEIVLEFCMSGELETGGIQFNEDPNHEKYGRWLTCATAPTAYANLQVYQATNEEQYFKDGLRLYEFMKQEGNWGIGPGYRGYENAVIMGTAILLYQITEEEQYLKDAYQLAYSMETQYIAWESGRLNETGQWGGHDMTDAYVELYKIDRNPRWLHIVGAYLIYLREHCRDNKGFYTEEWNGYYEQDSDREQLLYQASAASSFMKLASTPVDMDTYVKEPVAIFKNTDYNRNNKNNCWSMGLQIGDYTEEDLHFLGLTDSKFIFKADISSILIEDGYKVTLFQNGDLSGPSKVMYESSEDLKQWSNRAKSLRIESLNNVASFYTEEDFEGVSFELPEGKFSILELERLGVKEISSIKVADGYEVKVFDGEYFFGNSSIYRGEQKQLGEFDNKVSSVIISPRGADNIEESVNEQVVVYPSVVKDCLYMENLDSYSLIEIRDLSGVLFLTDEPKQENYNLNVSHLPQGMYLVRISNMNGSKVIKIRKAD